VQYLQHLLAVAGPINAGFQYAWRFERQRDTLDQSGARRLRRRSPTPLDTARKNHDLGDIAEFEYLDIAQHEGLFSRAEDVWSIIGWAFVCSVVHKERWERWKIFLELLLDALEKDWTLRCSDRNDDAEFIDLEGSLANSIGFIPELTGSAGYKRVIRAVFANGSDKSVREWQPIFQYEIAKKPKKEKVEMDYDLDSQGSSHNSLYGKIGKDIKQGGNYDKILNQVNHDMEGDSDSDHEVKPRNEAKDEDEDEEEDDDDVKSIVPEEVPEEIRIDPSEQWGGMEAIVLRQRLVNMVSL